MKINKYGQRVPVVTDTEIKGFFGEYRFLSNFEELKIAIPYTSRTCSFVTYYFPSSEAAYMAAKSNDISYLAQLETATPAQAKRLGKNVELVDNWDHIRLDAMYYAVLLKFYLNQDLREKLKATGPKYLEETNNWGDRFWGVTDGYGENNLGKILMEVRSQV